MKHLTFSKSIPYLKIACELNNLQSLMVAFSFYIAYFVMAIPSGWVLSKTGFKKGMMLGFWFMAIGCFIFVQFDYKPDGMLNMILDNIRCC